MAARRSRGDGGLYWDRGRERWFAAVTVGYTFSGKRIVKKASGLSKTAAQRKLKEIIRDHEDGLMIGPDGYTVAQAVNDWLAHGLNGRSRATITTCTILSNTHIIPALGARKLRDLRAGDVDKWLAEKSQALSTATLQRLHSCLNRAISRAMARDMVRRNVVPLCAVPQGQPGRTSKALTMAQAEAVLRAATHSRLHAYIVVSLLIGARTEELHALTWDHIDLDGVADADRRYRRTLQCGGQLAPEAIPRPVSPGGLLRCRSAAWMRSASCGTGKTKSAPPQEHAGTIPGWCSPLGTAPRSAPPTSAATRTAIESAAGVDSREWTPRELRHSFVSLLSDNDVPLEKISLLVGHKSTIVTELIYRKQIRPVLQSGAEAMDRIFGADAEP